MATNNAKPTIVPTMYSARTALWSLVYIAAFLALWWIYSTAGKLAAAREALAVPPKTPVSCEYFKALLPPGWAEYSLTNGTVVAHLRAGDELPMIEILAERDPAYAYRALDMNPAVALKVLDDEIEVLRLESIQHDEIFACVGSQVITVKPGVEAGSFLFTDGEFDLDAVFFYVGDVRYSIWGLWRDEDIETRHVFAAFQRRLFEEFDVPEAREAIDRPTVHSGHFTVESNRAAYEQIGRELALWKMFAARAEAEPDAALLPALQHYRNALRLLSSIRQERTVLGSEDFALYEKLLAERRKDVAEWFVILDKHVAMRDWQKARKQAKWIISHATLTGERIDVRRATEILNGQIPSEDEQN